MKKRAKKIRYTFWLTAIPLNGNVRMVHGVSHEPMQTEVHFIALAENAFLIFLSICILSFCNFVWNVLSLFSRRLNSSDVLHDNILNIVYRITTLCELKPSRRETTYYFSHNALVHTYTHTRTRSDIFREVSHSYSNWNSSLFPVSAGRCSKIYVSLTHTVNYFHYLRSVMLLTFRQTIASIAAYYLSIRSGCSDFWLKYSRNNKNNSGAQATEQWNTDLII